MFNRRFGVEIELTKLNIRQTLDVLKTLDIPLSEDTSYRHSGYNKWKVINDASVNDGCEVVSRILQGADGFAELEKVAKALANAGASADSSCGLHVHLDIKDFTANDLRGIIERYSSFEQEIDKFMPRSRRGESNTYCRSLIPLMDILNNRNTNYNYYNNAISYWNSDNSDMVPRGFYERYMKVNLQSYVRQRTIEFRHHSGTVNAKKITNWVKFIMQFTDFSKIKSGNYNKLFHHLYDRHLTNAEINQNHTKIFEVLCKNVNNYVSSDELTRHTSVVNTYLPRYITKLRQATGLKIKYLSGSGFKLICQDDNSIVTVCDNNNNNTDSIWNGIDNDLKTFYLDRIAKLA